MTKKKTFNQLLGMKEPLVWITAYDYPMAYCCEAAEVDMILVGDSGGMVQLGYDNTVPVTMDEMITMCKAVRRGAPNTFIVGDMPMGSYEITDEQAVYSAVRFIKEGGCDAVKLEGGERVVSRVEAIIKAGIPVIGHLGFTPQSMSPSVKGKTKESIDDISDDIAILCTYGVRMILFEAVIDGALKEARKQYEAVKFMSIGSGKEGMDGQLLIIHDILGFYNKFRPKFAKLYFEDAIKKEQERIVAMEGVNGFHKEKINMLGVVAMAIWLYKEDVIKGIFPSKEYVYGKV